MSRLYKNYNKKGTAEPRKRSHILFQAGYNPDSPRMLIELKGWVWKGETYPSNISTEGHDIDRGYVNLLLGNIIYENLDMGREEEFLRRESYSYTSAKKPPHAGLRKKIDDKRKTRIKRSTGRM